MWAQIFDELFAEFRVHQHNDLFVRRAFCGHIDSWFGFVDKPVNDFLDEIDFLVREIREHFFDFQCVPSDVWQGDRRSCLFGGCRHLSVGFGKSGAVGLLEEFWNFIDFLLWFCQNKRQESGYKGGLDRFFTFHWNLGFVDLGIEFRFDFGSEHRLIVVHKKIIPMGIVDCRNEFPQRFTHIREVFDVVGPAVFDSLT